MEFERTEPIPCYVFSFEQSDGTVANLDFSAPGELGDFAFDHQLESGQIQHFYAYHTETAKIFKYFVEAMASQPNAQQQFEQLDEALQQFEGTGLSPTELSQSQFTSTDLDEIHDRVEQVQHQLSFSSSDMSLVYKSSHTVCSMKKSANKVEVPHDLAWQFVAGIIWRSYADPDEEYSYNSRHSTQTFKAALVAATEGLLAREAPDQG